MLSEETELLVGDRWEPRGQPTAQTQLHVERLPLDETCDRDPAF
jgi:hypothetical protein